MGGGGGGGGGGAGGGGGGGGGLGWRDDDLYRAVQVGHVRLTSVPARCLHVPCKNEDANRPPYSSFPTAPGNGGGGLGS